MDDEIEASKKLFPIGELSARTRMNTVTLRAWERRYGLLKPQRTPSGHRLYSNDDVQRVVRINAWIARGVPVSKVRTLLDSATSTPDPAEIVDDQIPWEDIRCSLRPILHAGHEIKLANFLRQSLLDYPPVLFGQRIVGPMMRELKLPAGQGMAFRLQNAILTYVQCRLQHYGRRRRQKYETINMILGSGTPAWPLALLALQMQDSGHPVVLFGLPCAPAVWLQLILEKPDQRCLIYQDGRWNQREKATILEHLPQFKNLLLSGSAPILAGMDDSLRVYPSPQESAKELIEALSEAA